MAKGKVEKCLREIRSLPGPHSLQEQTDRGNRLREILGSLRSIELTSEEKESVFSALVASVPTLDAVYVADRLGIASMSRFFGELIKR